VATFATPPRTHEELIRAADRLQYLVKHHGKNSVMYETLGGEPPARPALAA
jgi:PleD family two-component response regulator